jgi:undecaprenyl-diphosphatase
MVAFRTIETLEGKDALLIGLAQSVSMIPGVSRAGATILGGLSLGLDRRSAVLFSFLLALPTMAAATGYDLVKHAAAFTNADLVVLAIGFCAAFISAWIVVRWFLRYAEQHSFIPFGIYRIALGSLWILFSLYH